MTCTINISPYDDHHEWSLYLALAPKVKLQIVTSLTDESEGVIYDHNVFIVQVTGVCTIKFNSKNL